MTAHRWNQWVYRIEVIGGALLLGAALTAVWAIVFAVSVVM